MQLRHLTRFAPRRRPGRASALIRRQGGTATGSVMEVVVGFDLEKLHGGDPLANVAGAEGILI